MIGLILIAAVSLHLEDVGEAEPAVVRVIVQDFSAAIEARTGEKVEETPKKDGSTAILRIYAGPTIVRVIVEKGAQTSTLDLRRDLQTFWRENFDRTAAELFPPAAKPQPNLELTTTKPTENNRNLWPVILGGTAATALTAGIIFGLNASSTKKEMEQGILFEPEFSDRENKLQTQALAANILIGAGVAAGVAAIITLLQ